MAAPFIPNLNTLRSGGGAGRGRGRGRGLSSLDCPSARSPQEDQSRNDRIVQQTDQDASVSRMSAVDAGYLEDPFARYFAPSEPQRRFPIINRGELGRRIDHCKLPDQAIGTYVRTKAIDNLVDRFLASNPRQKKQIVSLGSGTDTRYFRVMSRYGHGVRNENDDLPNFVYHEVDFPENTARKLKEISRHSELAGCLRSPVGFHSHLGPGQKPYTIVDSPFYQIHPVDLRTLDPSTEPPNTFETIDTSLPTLIISECCLCYLAPTAADAVALYFTKHFFPPSTPLGFALYEPIKPDDAFGKVMVSNLATRGIVLQTLKKYGSLEAQAARMRSSGFEASQGANIKQLWDEGVDEDEKERVAGLEMVDEVEEWGLLASHYCVVWAWRDGENDNARGIWDRWKMILQ